MAMGIVEGYCPGLGLECAGIVRKVGRNVHQIAPGDHVMLVSHGCFSTSVVADARGVMKMPKGLSFEEAAAMPCVYATAIHCLVNLGNLQEGQVCVMSSFSARSKAYYPRAIIPDSYADYFCPSSLTNFLFIYLFFENRVFSFILQPAASAWPPSVFAK